MLTISMENLNEFHVTASHMQLRVYVHRYGRACVGELTSITNDK